MSKFIDLDDIILELEDETKIDEAVTLAEMYDNYTGAIDDGIQYKQANIRNEMILDELKNLGIKSVTFKNLRTIMSNELYNKKIDLRD